MGIGDERKNQPFAFHAEKMGLTGADPSDMVEKFIQDNGVDEGSAEVLRGCPVSIQQAVMARGGMITARNPSGVLLKRIGDERQNQPLAFQEQMMGETGDP